MVVTNYGCIKNHASRSAFLYNVNSKRLGLLWFNTVAQDVPTQVTQDVPVNTHANRSVLLYSVNNKRLGLPVV